jgi:hypothetical protein
MLTAGSHHGKLLNEAAKAQVNQAKLIKTIEMTSAKRHLNRHRNRV